MKQHLRPAPLLATLLVTALSLTACGGGGGDGNDPPPSSPEGAYSGTLTASASADLQMVMLENNEFWILQGANSAGGFRVAGFVQGSGAVSGSRFSASDVRDFGFSPARSATLGASFNAPAGTISGSVNSSGALTSFSGVRIPAATFNDETQATLAQVAGNWSLQALTGETVALTIGANGSFTGSTSLACGFTGTVVPRPSAKNVFNLSITFGAAPCVLPNQTATGIALVAPLASGGRQLMLAGMTAQRTQGMAAFGSLP